MKKNLVKSLTLMAIISTLSASVFIGCGSKSSDDGVKKESENFNSTGYPVVKEDITIDALTQVSVMNGDFNAMKQFKDIAEKTGVKVNFEQVPDKSWEEKKNLLLASGDLPDIFYGGGLSNSDLEKYGKQGSLLPLENLIDKYAPNIKKILEKHPEYKKQITSSDGHIYTLFLRPAEVEGTIGPNLFINKAWLDKLGLQVPKTTEELYNVLKEFKEKDPNGNGKKDEVPLSYLADNMNNGDPSLFGAFGVIDYQNHLMIKDNKITYVAKEDGYKEGIKWFKQLYNEGLIDKEVFTHDQGQYQSKGKNDETLYGAFVGYFASEVVGADRAESEYVAIEPLKGPKGNQLWARSATEIFPGKFSITSKNDNPEATIRWVDEIFEPEMSFRLNKGEIGVSYEKKDDKFTMMTPSDGKSFDEVRMKNAPAFRTIGYISDEIYANTTFSKDVEKKREIFKMYDKYADKTPVPPLNFTSEQLDEMAIIFTDLNNYVKEMKGKWIIGERDVEKDWEEFIKNLENMGLNKILENYEKAYSEYKK